MTRTLVVPSPSLSPLSTDGPIPTDGQPQWSWCNMDGFRARGVSEVLAHPHPTKFDGPYPFTVAVWQEAPMPDVNEDAGDCIGDCGRRTNGWFAAGSHGPGWYCGWCEAVPAAVLLVSAVVATVEVTGEGHPGGASIATCNACIDLGSEVWHTPTGQVSRLDVPIPMERPEVCVVCDANPSTPHTMCWGEPAPWWWADIDLEAPA